MSKNITKSELIEVLASSLDISNSMAEKGINKVVERIVEKLSAGQGITLSGFELPIHIKQRIKGSAAESLLIQQADPEKKLSEVLKNF